MSDRKYEEFAENIRSKAENLYEELEKELEELEDVPVVDIDSPTAEDEECRQVVEAHKTYNEAMNGLLAMAVGKGLKAEDGEDIFGQRYWDFMEWRKEGGFV